MRSEPKKQKVNWSLLKAVQGGIVRFREKLKKQSLISVQIEEAAQKLRDENFRKFGHLMNRI